MEYLTALVLLLLLGRTLGMLFKQIGFQPLIGEVLAGIILGSAILGWVEPSEPLKVFGEFGIIMLMLVAGMMTDFDAFSKNMNSSIIIGAIGVISTFFIVYLPLKFVVGFSTNASLLMAAIMSNTAVEICARIYLEDRARIGRMGAVILGASFVDDIIAVFVVGIVSTMVLRDKTPGLAGTLWLAITILLFLVISMVIAAKVFEKIFGKLGRLGIKEEKLPLTATLIVAFFFAVLARQIGLHEVIGAYIAGLIIGRWGSKVDPLLQRRRVWNDILEDISAPLWAIFGPIFFGYIGIILSDILADSSFTTTMSLALLLIFLAIIGKVVGCGLSSRVCGFKKGEAIVLGFAMCGRGALELVLANYGLELEVLSERQFSALVAMVLATVVLTPALYTTSRKYFVDRKEGEISG